MADDEEFTPLLVARGCGLRPLLAIDAVVAVLVAAILIVLVVKL